MMQGTAEKQQKQQALIAAIMYTCGTITLPNFKFIGG